MDWIKLPGKMPPLHKGVLIRMKNAVGSVYDVACFVGKDIDGKDHWILADIRLDTKQITHWSDIEGPIL